MAVQLVYEDLARSRPTRCVARARDAADAAGPGVRLRAEERVFLDASLPVAFQTAFLLAAADDEAAAAEAAADA